MTRLSIQAKLSIVVIALSLGVTYAQLPTPTLGVGVGKVEHFKLQEPCMEALNEQINLEFYAATVYSAMYANFNRPSSGLQGYAKWSKEQSVEEFGHAQTFIKYLTDRDGEVTPIKIEALKKNQWGSALEALMDARDLENAVLAKIKYIHSVADQQCQDAHLTSWLEDVFLSEQIESINEITTMISHVQVKSGPDSSESRLLEYHENEKLSQ